MPTVPIAPRRAVRQVVDLARSVEVLYRRELVDPLRPLGILRTMRTAATAGPFVAALQHGRRRGPDSPALVDESGSLTFDQLDRESNALARGLTEFGVRPGDVAAVLCRDHRGLVLTAVAAGKIGVRVVLMNTGFAPPQFRDVATREAVTVIIHDVEFTTVVQAAPTHIRRIVADGSADPATPSLQSLALCRSTDALPLPQRPGGLVLLTSGTTGTPKGAPRERMTPFQSAQLLDRIPLSTGGTTVTSAPLFHGTGMSQLTLGLALGKRIVLQQRKFDPAATLAAVAQYRADTLVVVPTMLQRIVDLPPSTLAEFDTSSLQVIFCSGSALAPDLARRTREQIGDVLYNLYGSTEVAVATVATPDELRRAPGTAGRPPVGCRVALYDGHRQRITEPRVTGTIFVANGMSFGGYTGGGHKEIVDGLLSTGDVGHFDENGLLFVEGRDDDMIVSGGENVFPLEVENLLAERPDVLEVAVVGVDDPEFGKRLRAFIVAAPGAARDPHQIRAYIKDNLARHKVPRDVVFIDEIPRNATGKILRTRLEQMTI